MYIYIYVCIVDKCFKVIDVFRSILPHEHTSRTRCEINRYIEMYTFSNIPVFDVDV